MHVRREMPRRRCQQIAKLGIQFRRFDGRQAKARVRQRSDQLRHERAQRTADVATVRADVD